jgi:glutamate racemase
MSKPIGVFDSGVGGLTVLKALRRELPHQDFLYLGDTARVPYGRKPREMVQSFAAGITEFLIREGVQAVIIACNTASSAALPQLADESSVPVWGVIEPGVQSACRATRSGHVGVIGTKGTIRSGVYQKKLQDRGLKVWAQACPMFVHLVEEGLADSEEAELLARHYLGGRPDIDTLILGCTHYPVLRPVLERVAGDSVRLVESAQAIADVVRESVELSAIGPGKIVHYVTGDPLAYEHTAQVIGGVDGEIVPLPISKLVKLELAAATPARDTQ